MFRYITQITPKSCVGAFNLRACENLLLQVFKFKIKINAILENKDITKISGEEFKLKLDIINSQLFKTEEFLHFSRNLNEFYVQERFQLQILTNEIDSLRPGAVDLRINNNF